MYLYVSLIYARLLMRVQFTYDKRYVNKQQHYIEGYVAGTVMIAANLVQLALIGYEKYMEYKKWEGVRNSLRDVKRDLQKYRAALLDVIT